MIKYADIRIIGTGGFGEVTECERDSDGLRMAKKRLLASADEDAAKRFVREVRILSKLDHLNVVRVLAKHLDRPPYWFAMPLYARSLDQELASLRGASERIAKIFRRTLDGVEYAHSKGVIHRDLKPANILTNSDDDVVVADFGLGRILDSTSTRQTVTGWGMGTVMYTAPEQFANARDADARSDIYALGRILYDLYAGPISLGPQDLSLLPSAVSSIVDRCTQRLPERRYQTVTELREAWAATRLP